MVLVGQTSKQKIVLQLKPLILKLTVGIISLWHCSIITVASILKDLAECYSLSKLHKYLAKSILFRQSVLAYFTEEVLATGKITTTEVKHDNDDMYKPTISLNYCTS